MDNVARVLLGPEVAYDDEASDLHEGDGRDQDHVTAEEASPSGHSATSLGTSPSIIPILFFLFTVGCFLFLCS